MIVTQEIARIAQALLKDSAASLVEGTWQSLTPLNLTPGQVVQGEVMASLPQSRYLVRVANELLKMELPLNLQPGQAVELTYVTDEPRIIFALSKSANSGTPVQISDAGRWLNGLAQEGSPPSAATPLPRPSLILPSPPDNPATLAEGLRNTLSRSGNFYESHLAGWMRGERPLVELLKEPQGSLSRLAALLPTETAETPPATRQTSPPTTTSSAPPEGESPPVGQNPSPPAAATREGATTAPTAPPATASPAGESEPPPAAGMAASSAPEPTATAAPPEAAHSGQPAAAPHSTAPDTSPASTATPPAAPPAAGAAPAPAAPAHGTTVHGPAPHDAAAPTPVPPDGTPAPGAALPREVPPQPEREPLPSARAPELPPPAAAAAGGEPRVAAGGDIPPFSPIPNRHGEPHQDRPIPPPGAPTAGEVAGGASRVDSGAAIDRPAAFTDSAPPLRGGVEPQTIPIIREQLSVLTTGVFSWLGQVWPGQDMEWTVQEREAEGGKGGRSWQTEVRIAFPRLGEVRAVLNLAGEGVAVSLVAAEERTTALLSEGAERLQENMEGAGITLSGLTVRHGGV